MSDTSTQPGEPIIPQCPQREVNGQVFVDVPGPVRPIYLGKKR